MTAPAVEAEIDELIDLAWEVVYDLLLDRGECSATGFRRSTPHTAIHSWLEGLNWYTVVRSGGVAVLLLARGAGHYCVSSRRAGS